MAIVRGVRVRGSWRQVLRATLIVILIADVAVLVGSDHRGSDADPVEVMGHVVERAPAAAFAAARRAPQPARSPVVGRSAAPPSFWSGERPPPPPPAPLVAAPDWLEEQASQALDRISYPWRSLGFSVEFQPARRGLRAITYTYERRIVVFVRRGDRTAQTAFDLAHELGHAFDLVHGTWPLRERWFELRGIEASTPWFGCSGCDDHSTGAGDLAEVFALWQVGPVDFASRLAPPPGSVQLADLIQLFDPGWTSQNDPTRSRRSDHDHGQAGDGQEAGDGEGQDRGGGTTDSDDPPDHEPDDGSEDTGEDDEDQAERDGPLPCPVICGVSRAPG